MSRGVISILVLVLAAGLSAPASPLGGGKTISLDLEEAPLRTVLSMIARQNGFNIVVSGEVDGVVSLTLNDVEVEVALEAILSPNGYNYYMKGDVVVVKPVEMYAVGETVSRLVTLKYQDAGSIKAALDPRVTPKGNVVILDKPNNDGSFTPNQLLISDLPSVVDDLVDLADAMDSAQRLISIEVKIIENKVDDQTKLGFNWPSQVSASLGSSTSSDESSDDGTTTEDGDGGTLDYFAGSYNPNAGDWTWGTLTVEQVSMVLDMLDQSGRSKLISDPHLTTLENHQAEIAVETVIPIPTVNRFTEGAAVTDILTFQDEEVGISLLVTPRISGPGRITLDVFPEVEDIIGYSGPPENRKPITASRSIRTRITVDDGETIVLGGLLKEDEIITENKLPILGHIPLLGGLLFTNKSTEKATTDLLILITPRIVTNSGS